MGYRDPVCDGTYWNEAYPFVRTADELAVQMQRLEAKGGGDEPESLLDASHVLCNAPATDPGAEGAESWRHPGDALRCVMVVTNASFRPATQGTPPCDTAGATCDDVVQAINSAKIRLLALAPDTSEYDQLLWANKAAYACELTEPYVESLDAMASEVIESSFECLSKTLEWDATKKSFRLERRVVL